MKFNRSKWRKMIAATLSAVMLTNTWVSAGVDTDPLHKLESSVLSSFLQDTSISSTAVDINFIGEGESSAELEAMVADYDMVYSVIGGYIYFNSETGTIVDVDETSVITEIPSAIDGVEVKAIGERAFYNNTKIKELTIPDTVTFVDSQAFGECTEMNKLIINSDIETKYSANSASDTEPFNGCDNLREVVFGENVTVIPDGCFIGCTGLTSVMIPKGVTSIGERAFSGCIGLTKLDLPDSLDSIDRQAFYGCTGLSELTLHGDIAFTGNQAFGNCTGLTKLTINGDCINDYSLGTVATTGTFNACTNLSEIVFGEAVTVIPKGSFTNCTGLTELVIPEGVTSIEERAFSGCIGLTKITLPLSVVELGNNVFSGCTDLTIVCLPGSAAEEYAKKNSISYVYPEDYSNFTLTTGESCSYGNKSVQKVTLTTDKAANYIVYSPEGKIERYGVNTVVSEILNPDEKIEMYNNTVENVSVIASSSENTFESITGVDLFTTMLLKADTNYIIDNPSDEEIQLTLNADVRTNYVVYNRGTGDVLDHGYNKSIDGISIASGAYMVLATKSNIVTMMPAAYGDTMGVAVAEDTAAPFTAYELPADTTIKLRAAVAGVSIPVSGRYYSAVRYGMRYIYGNNTTVDFALEKDNESYMENRNTSAIFIYLPTEVYNNGGISVQFSDKKLDELQDSYLINVDLEVMYPENNGEPEWESLKNFRVSVYNNTKGMKLTDTTVSYGRIFLLDNADVGDSITVTLTKSGFAATSQTVTLDDMGIGSVSMVMAQYGSVKIKEGIASSDEAIRTMLFDKNGRIVKALSISADKNEVDLGRFEDGNYTLVLLRSNGTLWKISSLSELEEYAATGAEEGTDYILLSGVRVNAGEATEVNVDSIPTMDESKLSYLDRDNTEFYAMGDEETVDALIRVRFAFSIKNNIYNNVTKESHFTFHIPEGLSFVSNSIVLDGNKISYEESTNSEWVTVDTEVQSGVIVFYVRAVDYGENYEIVAKYEGENRTETVGYAQVDVPKLTISCPDTVSEDGVNISGFGSKNSFVSIYLNDELVKTSKVSNMSKYKEYIPFKDACAGYTYNIRVVSGDKEAETNVLYNPHLPEALEFYMGYEDHSREHWIDLLDSYNSSISPVVRFYYEKPFEFRVKMSNADRIDSLRIVGVRDGQELSIDAVREDDGYFVAKGYFGDDTNRIIPSTISIDYVLKELTNDVGDAALATSILSPTISGYEVTESIVEDDYISIKSQSGDGQSFFDYELTKNSGNVENFEEAKEYAIPVQVDGKTYYMLLTYLQVGDWSSEDSSDDVQAYSNSIALDILDIINNEGVTKIIEVINNYYEIKDTVSEDIENAETLGDLFITAGIDVIDVAGNKVVDINFNTDLLSLANGGISQGNVIGLGLDIGTEIANGAWEYHKAAELEKIDPVRAEQVKEKVIRDTRENILVTATSGAVGLYVGAVGTATCGPLVGWFAGAVASWATERIMEDIMIPSARKLNYQIGVKWVIDPSGYVYEMDPSNRIEGVTATAYYMDTEGNAVLWDAYEYGQKNPLLTDEDGFYAWDVPEGQWQVKYEKEGYETTYSDWLPVPPPQLDVNINMYSSIPPSGKSVVIKDSAIELTFDRHIDVNTVTDENLVLTDSEGSTISKTIEAVLPVEYNGTDNAMIYRIIPDMEISPEDVFVVTLKTGIIAYNGVRLESDQTLSTREMPVVSIIYGDADMNNILSAADASYVLQKVLDASFITGIEEAGGDYMTWLDVNADGTVTAADASMILQKTLDNSFMMPCEE